MDTLKFDLVIHTVPIELTLPDGTVNNYTLRELTGAQRELYQEFSTKNVEYNEQGMPTRFKSVKGLQSYLINLSLVDAKGANVPQATIETWPAQVVEGLTKAAQKLSNLGLKSAEEAAVAKKD